MILLPFSPSVFEEPVFRKFLRVCKDIEGRGTHVMNRPVEFFDLVVIQSVAVLLWVDLGMVQNLVSRIARE